MKTYSREFKNRIVELYRAGLSSVALRKLYGLSQETIWRWCKERGVGRTKSEAQYLHNKTRERYEKAEEAAFLRLEGLSWRKVAEVMGISKTGAYQLSRHPRFIEIMKQDADTKSKRLKNQLYYKKAA
ncbi:MAG: hypothetical protein D6800_06815 [Candidatus Zixiibacteriota bacterium]|nr:MAG: hypothetical protein D6800_06815 [candidate division Zixibacteria bacterium]